VSWTAVGFSPVPLASISVSADGGVLLGLQKGDDNAGDLYLYTSTNSRCADVALAVHGCQYSDVALWLSSCRQVDCCPLTIWQSTFEHSKASDAAVTSD
jgi:hypothetical protein